MIQVINRSIDILEYVAEEANKPKLMGNIAQDLNLNTSTCANIIKTLVNRGLLRKADDEKGYLIGHRLKAYDSSTGRLLIAFLEERDLHLYIKKYGLPNKNTWSKATSRIGFFEQIEKIKAQGYALIEDTVQVVGVATPIFKGSKVIASFSIYLPSFRFNNKVKADMIKQAIDLSKMLSIK